MHGILERERERERERESANTKITQLTWIDLPTLEKRVNYPNPNLTR